MLEPGGKLIRLHDGTGWTCDVECTATQWAACKRAARRERMKVADWLMEAVEIGVARILAQHKAGKPID